MHANVHIYVMASNTKTTNDSEEIVAASPMNDTKDLGPPSLMSRKFIHAAESNYSPPPLPVYSFCKEFQFFYGTLMDAQTLAKVLKLHNLPLLVPAKISGYHCKLWGEYPALVGSERDEPVYGMAYEVQSPDENELLEAYETDRYLRIGCIIEFEDGTEAIRSTFKWRGNKMELKEGEFNLKDWKLDRLEQEIHSARHHWSQDR
ncbi:hypothetical protein VE03_09379 [Pseudogymnoascus sp. 23342-1-I1]|nr:hypothetical protein VE03_09379 [Pseudogymnoascus sp. 23342-1-I1]